MADKRIAVGKFQIWPDSDTEWSNRLRIEGKRGQVLVLTSSTHGFHGKWGPEGWFVDDNTFGKLVAEEAKMLQDIGAYLPPGNSSFAEETMRDLKTRVSKIGSNELEKIFEKVFKLCRNEVRRRQRPHLLQWLPF